MDIAEKLVFGTLVFVFLISITLLTQARHKAPYAKAAIRQLVGIIGSLYIIIQSSVLLGMHSSRIVRERVTTELTATYGYKFTRVNMTYHYVEFTTNKNAQCNGWIKQTNKVYQIQKGTITCKSEFVGLSPSNADKEIQDILNYVGTSPKGTLNDPRYVQ